MAFLVLLDHPAAEKGTRVTEKGTRVPKEMARVKCSFPWHLCYGVTQGDMKILGKIIQISVEERVISVETKELYGRGTTSASMPSQHL